MPSALPAGAAWPVPAPPPGRCLRPGAGAASGSFGILLLALFAAFFTSDRELLTPAFSRAATTRAFSRATRRSLGGAPANLRAARRCDGSWRTETELLSGRGALAFEYLDGRTNEILRGERFSPPTLRTGAVMLILTAVALEKKSENNDYIWGIWGKRVCDIWEKWVCTVSVADVRTGAVMLI